MFAGKRHFTGAMIFGLVWLVAGIRLGWRFEWLFLVTLLDLLPFGPALFRYSRVVWMHLDRLIDRDPETSGTPCRSRVSAAF